VDHSFVYKYGGNAAQRIYFPGRLRLLDIVRHDRQKGELHHQSILNPNGAGYSGYILSDCDIRIAYLFLATVLAARRPLSLF
jgi:hypothetical protein